MQFSFRGSFLLVFLMFMFSCSVFTPQEKPEPLTINTIHGTLVVDDPLAIELINSPAMQRLKNIKQYGTTDYLYPVNKPYNRFVHSLGVYFLLKKYNLPRKEQIAGLLHDVSHTAFSHATDVLFVGTLNGGAYQDQIHVEFLKKHGIEEILNKYDIKAEEMDLLTNEFKGLKQKHPTLCADRIEYIIYAGYKEGTLSQEEMAKIHESLAFDGDQWFFQDPEAATLFSQIPLKETVRYWGGPEGLSIGHLTSKILKTAFDENVITRDEVLYDKTDDELWHQVTMSASSKLQEELKQFYAIRKMTKNLPQTCDVSKRYFSKFRAVNPFIQTNGGERIKLTKLNPEFAKNYRSTKEEVKKGWCLPIGQF